ncbi:YGGT family protein [Corynebacterium capitovis DSM 44611]|uniref:YggT family protein n=1 Tax=Corynebacterium capitovis TaxID=131081 RepID=UPI00037B2B86|nr:YggT family protein [Corynebacterium capitovis]WKD57373.1 YGGT family protein [Corynebacterium capitovis DSM 44611]
MALFGSVLYALLGVYSLVVVVRLIIEMIHSFSKQFDPPRWFTLVAEPLFVVTDPPVNALRRLVPPVRLGGGMGLDVSIIVLFLGLAVAQLAVYSLLVVPALN